MTAGDTVDETETCRDNCCNTCGCGILKDENSGNGEGCNGCTDSGNHYVDVLEELMYDISGSYHTNHAYEDTYEEGLDTLNRGSDLVYEGDGKEDILR